MPPVKLGRRQIEQPLGVLINQPAALFRRGPVLSGDGKRGAHALGLPLDDRQRLARLAGDDRRHAVFENAGLLGGDLDERVAQKFVVIERQSGDDADHRALDDIGGIEPATEADFKQERIGWMAREQQKSRRGLDLEHGDRRGAILRLAFGEDTLELGIADQPAAVLLAEAEPLVQPYQIGRGVNVHAFAGRFEHRAHECDGRALAIGAGDMDDRRQPPFRMIELGQKALDAAERQVDAPGMQRQQPRQHGVDRRGIGRLRAHVTAVATAGAGRLRGCGAPAGALVKSRHSLAMVARNWWRCTTMSTMP